MPNRKERYKNMDLYRKTRKAQKQRYYHKTSKYERRPWTEEEEKEVLRHKISDMELSVKISRSVLAIQIKRSRLKNM